MAGVVATVVRSVRHRRRVAALRLVRGRARHRVAGPRPADVRGLAGPGYLPGRRLRGVGCDVPGAGLAGWRLDARFRRSASNGERSVKALGLALLALVGVAAACASWLSP